MADVSFLATQCTNTTSSNSISQRLLSRFWYVDFNIIIVVFSPRFLCMIGAGCGWGQVVDGGRSWMEWGTKYIVMVNVFGLYSLLCFTGCRKYSGLRHNYYCYV